MQPPELVAVDGGAIMAVCPHCGQRVELQQVQRSAQDVADTPAEAVRIRMGLLMHANPTTAAQLQAVDEAAENVHTDVDFGQLEQHVRQEHDG